MSKQKSIPQRDAIPQEYTWNTADLYPTDEAWKEEFQTLKSLTQKLEGYAGRLGESAQTLYDFVTLEPERCSASSWTMPSGKATRTPG